MKRKWTLSVSMLVLIFLAARSPAFSDDHGDEQKILRILELFEDAYVESNAELLAPVLADCYVMAIPKQTDPASAVVFDKDQTLDGIARRTEESDYLEHGHGNIEIDIDGPLARSTSTIHDRFADGSTSDQRILHIYAKEGGIWKVLFSTTLLTED
jgi:hypothetical protein